MKKFILISLLISSFAKAECPKNEIEIQEKAPIILIQTVAQKSKNQTTDFSGKIGKGGAVSGTASIKAGTETWYFVRADYKSESVSGIVKCDLPSQQLKVVSFGWHSGKGSGVAGVE